jgi:hypothetical protein
MLGYPTVTLAAVIVRDAKLGRENYSEGVTAMYGCDPKKAVRAAFRNRKSHRGFMAHYPRAKQLVQYTIDHDDDPTLLMSW